MTNIAELFTAEIGGELEPSFRELPIDSPCGEDCRRAIVHAKGLIDSVRQAHGDDAAPAIEMIQDITVDVLETFWKG